uniref:Uncharacterized protein n=1 Tax=Arundo donax TaxID=35708 RepID=A0A0A9FI27_ARUDO
MNNYLYWFGLGIFHSGIEGTDALTSSCSLAFCYRNMIWLLACCSCRTGSRVVVLVLRRL